MQRFKDPKGLLVKDAKGFLLNYINSKKIYSIKKPLHICKPFFDRKRSTLLSPQSQLEK